MLLRITYSNTKMFFKRARESFKSYFPRGYQRLPNTSPCNPFSCTGNRGTVNRLHTNRFTHSYRESSEKMTPSNHRTKAYATTTRKETISKYIVDSKKPDEMNNNIYHDGNQLAKDEAGSSKCLVTRKLKELETTEGANVDLVHDIEEVLHYYSRLTCPVYRDIMEKFFLQVYSGTFNLSGRTLIIDQC